MLLNSKSHTQVIILRASFLKWTTLTEYHDGLTHTSSLASYKAQIFKLMKNIFHLYCTEY